MDLAPYLETLRRDLVAAAAPAGPEVTRAAELLTAAIDSAARLCLLEALSAAAAEVTSGLDSASVELRLRDGSAEFVVTALPAPAPVPPPVAPDAGGEQTRITLRMPEGLKEAAERAAGAEGVSVNAWLVRAVSTALAGSAQPPSPPPGRASARRITGFARS